MTLRSSPGGEDLFMTVQQSKFRLAADPVELETVEALLERYPAIAIVMLTSAATAIADADMLRVASYLREASSLDVGLLSSNKEAWAAQEKLRADRPDLFRTSARSWMIGLVVIIVSALLIYWLTTFADA